MTFAPKNNLIQEIELTDATVDGLDIQTPSEGADVYIFPASLEQHRYWILDQVDRHSTASNMAIAFHLEGEVDDLLVERCIRDLTLRHEALRTTYRMVDGELSQIICEEPLYDFAVTDLRSLPAGQRPQRAEEVIRDQSHVAMDLAAGPVFYTRLIHLSDEEHFLACTVHHIACDGWSNGVLVRDFAEIYTAYAQQRDPKLADLPFQFADFSIWQKQWLESEEAQAALTFWKEQIQRGAVAVDLPTDEPRNARKDGPGDIEWEMIPPELHNALKAYCRQREATMHQVLLTAFEALISRYTGQDHFLLGSSIANRTQLGMDDVVGRFANPQVIVAEVEKNPSFHELLQRVIEWSGKAYAHQDLPFSRLMEEFQLDQSGAASQFLQVYFVYQKAFMQPQQAGELKIVPRPSVSGGVNFDMLVSIVERASGPRLQIEYNTDLFRQDRIRHFILRYLRLLEAVMENDRLRVSDIPVLSAEEELALDRAGRGPVRLGELPASLIEAFDRHAEHRGEAAAIIAGRHRTSWMELAEKSLVFAAALQERGVRPGQHVALRMEPNADAAAAALAILRLRAVVLAVPGATTPEEWDRILMALQPPIALASAGFTGRTSTTTWFDQLKKAEAKLQPLFVSKDDDPAWAGIAIDSAEHYHSYLASHRTALESLTAAAQTLRMRAGDTALVVPAETSADAWTDLMLPLTTGAGIVWHTGHAADHLQQILDREQVSLGFATPSDWLTLTAGGWSGDRRLEMVCRGSRLPSGLAKRLQPIGRIWSMASSAQTGGIIGLTALAPGKTGIHWPIAPLPGQQLTILDHRGNTVPGEVPGELALANDGDAVRTGWLARRSPQGEVELIDAVQRQIRLHNYRLRLGELEDHLLNHPSVTAAKASVQNSPNGTPELVAYVAGGPGSQPSAQVLSEFLRSTAPAHLASAEILPVPSIPLRLNGTPDLALLPRPDKKHSARVKTGDYVPPRDELESRLVRIWEEVLGIEGIGVRTSFFDLGGYSLMIVRLFARINKTLSTSLPITTIFNAPTVEQLADILRGRSAYSSLVPVQKGTNKPPFFLIHSYLLYGGLPSVIGKDYPFYGLRELDRDGDMTIEQRIATYIREIRTAQPHGPYYIGGWCAAGPLAVETARQLVSEGEQVGLVVLFDSWRPGYPEDLARDQDTKAHMTLGGKLSRKYTYHQRKMQSMTSAQKAKYFWTSAIHKVKTVRDQLYLRNWAAVQWLFKHFGLELPHFMHNISLNTLNAVRLYKTEPFDCRITLFRATETQHISGASADCGWSAIAKDGVEVFWAPGSHESMFIEPNLSMVGNMLRECLEKAYRQPA
ncbi:condensation domain-containing protein [Paracidobacterium acidisoli]|uniref:Carrier domain-containing protein n=1 Tax=Paracidobacterium acidisoli TaxID=2303751 RepID=A0A372IRI6_9BACT|nr:condensation domain-containing protein [Paracidobacterium acidisoli]MBT9330252.1 AMP-binding protein [Paracidobacterium acidisoli]